MRLFDFEFFLLLLLSLGSQKQCESIKVRESTFSKKHVSFWESAQKGYIPPAYVTGAQSGLLSFPLRPPHRQVG